MGEVYRAHDATLGRDVAIKILPDVWLADPDRRARFDREARVLASLNHPNIGAIYGLHEDASEPPLKALVLELVEGDTLAERILHHRSSSSSRRGLPVDEVTTIAAQIADALGAAHDRGIIHRDLKPGNIKITPEGRVKVLDFGLARTVGASAVVADLTQSPTMTLGGTAQGVVLGTAPYVSPEQARGHAVDQRTDIWAFGCLLYEMLTGVAPFRGEGIADVLASVLTSEPDWSRLPGDISAGMRVCVYCCLQKKVERRFHDIGDVRLALDGAFEQPGVTKTAEAPRRRAAIAYAGWAVAAVVAVAAGATFLSRDRAPAVMPETRLQIVTPDSSDPASLAVSPDGRSVVFAAGAGQTQLFLRRLDQDEARVLPGTEGALMPFWSPDNESIGFFAASVLKRLDLANGFVRTIANAPQPRRGTWNRMGTILFGAGSVGPLSRVSAEGGAVQQASTLLPGQTNHRFPEFLQDGQRFLFYTLGAADVRGIYLGSLFDTSVRRIADRELAYGWTADYVLFARQGALWARRLNRDQTALEGALIPVAPRVLVSGYATGYGAFSASPTGTIVDPAATDTSEMVWVDRAGRVVTRLGQPDDSQIAISALSRDGNTAAISRRVDGNPDVWLVDTARGVPRRLTVDPGDDGNALLSPDGSRVIYVADGKDDVYQIYERRADGSGEATLLFESGENKNPSDWSPDGRTIVYSSQSSETGFDVWALPLTGDKKPFPILRTRFDEIDGRFSPDGRWIAYFSGETGRPEIYVQPFPGSGAKIQVSIGGGIFPRWARNGRELFYIDADARLMAVSLSLDGARLVVEQPRALFRMPAAVDFMPSSDGQRFLTTVPVSGASPISVILSWKPPS